MANKKQSVTIMDEMNDELSETIPAGLPASVEEVPAGEEKHAEIDNVAAKAELDNSGSVTAFDDFTDDDFEERSAAFLKAENIPTVRTKYIFDGFQYLELPALDGSGEVRPTKCAVLIDQNTKERFLCAVTTVVRGMEQVTTIPAPVMIQNNGKKVSSNRTTYYDVKYWIAKGFAQLQGNNA